jgi:hypothetical protein
VRYALIKRWVIGLLAFALTAGAKPLKKTWIYIHPHLYLGLGMVDVFDETAPPFTVETDADITYLNINSFKSRSIAFQYQARLNVLGAGPVSLGYVFWGHRFNYDTDYPELWIRPGKLYPQRYDLSFHAASLQLDSPFTFWEDRLRPFLLGGAGPFFGSYVEGMYAVDVINGWIWLNETLRDEYKGWAWMTGAGLVIYRYAYFYVGIVQFNEPRLPASLFFDMVVGVHL